LSRSTRTGIYLHYQKADVLHAEAFFAGMYPFIDDGKGGSINSMWLKANGAHEVGETRPISVLRDENIHQQRSSSPSTY
jgi:hypothetical protein